MTRTRIAAGALGAAMTAAALVPGPAQAAAEQASAACSMTLGTATVQGDLKFQRITATAPVTAAPPSVGTKTTSAPASERQRVASGKTMS